MLTQQCFDRNMGFFIKVFSLDIDPDTLILYFALLKNRIDDDRFERHVKGLMVTHKYRSLPLPAEILANNDEIDDMPEYHQPYKQLTAPRQGSMSAREGFKRLREFLEGKRKKDGLWNDPKSEDKNDENKKK